MAKKLQNKTTWYGHIKFFHDVDELVVKLKVELPPSTAREGAAVLANIASELFGPSQHGGLNAKRLAKLLKDATESAIEDYEMADGEVSEMPCYGDTEEVWVEGAHRRGDQVRGLAIAAENRIGGIGDTPTIAERMYEMVNVDAPFIEQW